MAVRRRELVVTFPGVGALGGVTVIGELVFGRELEDFDFSTESCAGVASLGALGS